MEGGEEKKEIKEVFPVVISEAAAVAEVTAYLDAKRVKPLMRSARMGNIGILVQAVMYGEITINHETWVITHKLNFPINDQSGNIYKKELEYKFRVSLGEISEIMRNVSDSTEMGNTKAYGAALTGLPAAVIEKLDTSDSAILASIGVFFS